MYRACRRAWLQTAVGGLRRQLSCSVDPYFIAQAILPVLDTYGMPWRTGSFVFQYDYVV